MKIVKLLNYNNRLIELILFKNFFKKDCYINSTISSEIALHIKKILHIVYKYHKLNKKILFLGTPIENHFYIEKFIKSTKHIAIPESVWVNGFITNKKSCFKYLVKKQIYSKNNASKLLLKLNEQVDLILIINNIENKSLAQEILNSQIPIIYLNNYENSNKNFIDSNSTLGINFNFFFSLLKALIKNPQKKTSPLNTTKKKNFIKKV